MMRAALALMAGLMCMAAGFRQAAALRAADARLRRWTEMVRHLALLLSEGTCTLPEAFTLAASGDGEADRLLRSLAEQMRRQPLKSLPEIWRELRDESPEAAPLTRMMQRLGRGSLESRQQAAEQAASELELLADQAREKALKDAKMWRTLGALGGACMTIMLL